MGADLALSVAMTTVSTAMSAAMLPINLSLYLPLAYDADVLHHISWPFLGISIAVILAAVFTGLFIAHMKLKGTSRSKIFVCGNVAGFALIGFSVAVSSVDEPVWDKP